MKQVGRALEMRFTLPTGAVDGEDLTKPLEIEVFRRGETVAGKKSAEPNPSARPNAWLALRRADLREPAGEGKVEYVAEPPAEEFNRLVGGTFSFEVRTLTRGFRGRPIESDPSNVVTLTVLDVPQPVTGPSVEATQAALDLRWSAPAETLTGKPAGPISGYRVYRSERETAGLPRPDSYRPIGETRETSYADTTFEFRHFYSYKVRALVTGHGSSAESQDSTAVEILPRDVFPPAAPAGLTALYTANGVELIWSPNLERDLAGYNIRRHENGGRPEQLNRELLRSTLYRDTAVQVGHRYFYRVTAVDVSGNESGPSPEVEVEVP